MKKYTKLSLLSLIFLSLFAFVGCEDNNMEDAADSMGDAAENAADNVGDAVENAADNVEDATN